MICEHTVNSGHLEALALFTGEVWTLLFSFIPKLTLLSKIQKSLSWKQEMRTIPDGEAIPKLPLLMWEQSVVFATPSSSSFDCKTWHVREMAACWLYHLLLCRRPIKNMASSKRAEKSRYCAVGPHSCPGSFVFFTFSRWQTSEETWWILWVLNLYYVRAVQC